MQFRFDDDQLAMRDAVRSFCVQHVELGVDAWPGLTDLGVLDVLVDVGPVEAAIVFEVLGAHLVVGPVLWTALGRELGVEGRVAGVEGDSQVVEHGAEADVLLVVRGDRVERCEVPPHTEASPLDPLTPCVVVDAIPPGEDLGDATTLRLHGQVLSAAMLVGVAQGALDTAREYALEREQFDRPIGSFQAVKHLLADMYVRVELARAAAYAAAAIAAGRGDGDPHLAASSAKLLAADAGIANGRSAVQVLGGMGFTWDMLPHWFLKRAWVLEHQFGTQSAHALRLAASMAP
jgi:hypothetical protein